MAPFGRRPQRIAPAHRPRHTLGQPAPEVQFEFYESINIPLGPARNGKGQVFTSPDGNLEVRVMDEDPVTGESYARMQNLENGNYLDANGKAPSTGSKSGDNTATHIPLSK